MPGKYGSKKMIIMKNGGKKKTKRKIKRKTKKSIKKGGIGIYGSKILTGGVGLYRSKSFMGGSYYLAGDDGRCESELTYGAASHKKIRRKKSIKKRKTKIIRKRKK
jgi:hypothetical protein